ncbi:uncharacterized protein ASCRUDRAFT_20985, partial [Ascoidea rubescens DSM 1968]
NNFENRTIYLGNLHPQTTVEEICNVVRSGILQSVKLISEKNICFLVFIYASAATHFFAQSNLKGLVIHHRRIRIGWGKNPGELPNSIALAVTAGASRNVYIGVIDENHHDNDTYARNINNNNKRKPSVPEESVLRKDFSEFGNIEQINFFLNGFCAFVNFMNISSAIKAVNEFNGIHKDDIHRRFDNRYVKYRIRFAKDRCGNPPKVYNNDKQNSKNKSSNFNLKGKNND